MYDQDLNEIHPDTEDLKAYESLIRSEARYVSALKQKVIDAARQMD